MLKKLVFLGLGSMMLLVPQPDIWAGESVDFERSGARPERVTKRTGRSLQIPTPSVALKPGEAPRIDFLSTEFDFGEVREGEKVSHEFVFQNTGSGPLEILAVKPTCGCTVPGQYDRIVHPGASGKIPFTISTSGRGGLMHKYIKVFTNAPKQAQPTRLTIKGTVRQLFTTTPRLLNFGRLQTDTELSEVAPRKLTIVNNTDRPADLTIVQPVPEPFEVELVETESGKQYQLTAKLKCVPEPGKYPSILRLTTGVAEKPSLTVQLRLIVQADAGN